MLEDLVVDEGFRFPAIDCENPIKRMDTENVKRKA
jgi:hypothetical protein